MSYKLPIFKIIIKIINNYFIIPRFYSNNGDAPAIKIKGTYAI